MTMIHQETTLYTVEGWVIAHLSAEASAQLPSRGQVMVKGAINDLAFQEALEPDGNGGHWLHVTKDMQREAGVHEGDTVELAIEATKDWPEPVIPADVQAALDADPNVFERWMDTTPMARWEWLRWINSTNNEQTRKKRIEVSCSKMLNGWRRPCCFNRNMCCVPQVSKSGVLIDPR